MFEVTSFYHLFPLSIFFIYTVYCINSDCQQAVGYIYKILHIDVTKGCKIYKAIGYEKGETFIVPHLLRYGTSVFVVSSLGPPYLDQKGWMGGGEDQFYPESPRKGYFIL